jgi:hypothetical protein
MAAASAYCCSINHSPFSACRADAANVGEPGAVLRRVRHAVPAGCALRSASFSCKSSSDRSCARQCIPFTQVPRRGREAFRCAMQLNLVRRGVRGHSRHSPPCRCRAAAAAGAEPGMVPHRRQRGRAGAILPHAPDIAGARTHAGAESYRDYTLFGMQIGKLAARTCRRCQGSPASPPWSWHASG